MTHRNVNVVAKKHIGGRGLNIRSKYLHSTPFLFFFVFLQVSIPSHQYCFLSANDITRTPTRKGVKRNTIEQKGVSNAIIIFKTIRCI